MYLILIDVNDVMLRSVTQGRLNDERAKEAGFGKRAFEKIFLTCTKTFVTVIYFDVL